MPDPASSTAYDRYAYVNNNPINFNDPSGHCISGAIADTVMCVFVGALVVGAITDGAQNAISQYQETGAIDWAEVAENAMEGAVIGGAPFVAFAAAPELLSMSGYGLWTAGQSIGNKGLSSAGTSLYSSSITINQFMDTQITRGIPIPQKDLSNFDQGKARLTIFRGEDTLYRLSSSKRSAGNYWTTTLPKSEIQWRIDQAVDPVWGNPASTLSTIKVPAGRILIGASGSASYQGGFYIGGGNQVYLPYVPKNWISPAIFGNSSIQTIK